MFCVCLFVLSLNVLESFSFLLRPIDGFVEPGMLSGLLVYFACGYVVNMIELISLALCQCCDMFCFCIYYMCGGLGVVGPKCKEGRAFVS